jgi:hypothetical protein
MGTEINNTVKPGGKPGLNITVLSLTCCNPKFKTFDDRYVSRLKEALSRLGLGEGVKIEVASAQDALFGLKVVNPKKIWDLFDKYGTAVAPVLLVNGEVALYGGVPTVERLVDAIGKAVGHSPGPS